MSKSLIVATLAVALIDGCGGKPNCGGHYHFHSSFPAEWREAARSGVEKWNAFSDKRVTLEDGDEDTETCSFKVVAAGSPEYVRLTPNDGSSWAGVSNGYDGSIAFCPDHWGDWVGPLEAEHVAMHELGHVHGMVHITDPGVMNPSEVPPPVEYTSFDSADCNAVLECR